MLTLITIVWPERDFYEGLELHLFHPIPYYRVKTTNVRLFGGSYNHYLWVICYSPPSSLVRFYPSFHIMINPPTTQHNISMCFYLFPHIYLHKFLPQCTNYGTQCSLNLSEVIFSISAYNTWQVNNYKAA